MYKSIKIQSTSGNVYVVKTRNNVGSKELTKALSISNPELNITNVGIYNDSLVVEEGSVIVLVDSSYDSKERVVSISTKFEGCGVILLDEFSAYSNEYEAKHIRRSNEVKAGFTYSGLNFQIDDTSRINITGKALELQLDTTIENINWISNTKDSEGRDIVHTFTRDGFIEFAKAMANYYESIILSTKE